MKEHLTGTQEPEPPLWQRVGMAVLVIALGMLIVWLILTLLAPHTVMMVLA